MCLCQEPVTQNNFAVWMAASIKRVMQQWCWSRGSSSSKDREASLARKLLEDSYIVLRLSATPAEERPEIAAAAVYLHVGYTNFKTWKMSMLRLHTVGDGQRENALLPLSITDLDCTDLPDILSNEDELQSVLEILSEEGVFTLEEALKASVKFEHPQTLSLFKVTEPSDAVARDRPPGFLYVREMPAADYAEVEIWKGCQAEVAARVDRGKKRRRAARIMSARVCSMHGGYGLLTYLLCLPA